jgi:ABC-type branched-subunit amino acid transport system substrate-binding protein
MRPHVLRAASIVGGLSLVVIMAACGSSSSSSSATTAAPTTSSGGSTTSSGGSTTSVSGNTASDTGVTANSILIGYITDDTGVAASTFAGSEKGAEAAIAGLNAAGGIDGRQVKLVTVDDGSTTSGNLTAAQLLVSKKVFGVIENSTFAQGSAQYLNQQGVPVTGDCCNEAVWGTQPNTNMFSRVGGVDPTMSSDSYTYWPTFLKSTGVTNLALFAYTDDPSSVVSIQDLANVVKQAGIKVGYEDLAVPFGTADFTAEALSMKKAGVNGALCSCVQTTNIAMLTGAKQAGVDLKVGMGLAGVDPTLFSTATVTAAVQGSYWETFSVPLGTNSAINTMVANLKKYDSSYAGGYPSFGITIAYEGAGIMFKGLQLAGNNPTRKSFISNMLQLQGFDDGGLLPAPVNYTNFGSYDPTSCAYFTQVQGTNFVAINGGKPFCGTLVKS